MLPVLLTAAFAIDRVDGADTLATGGAAAGNPFVNAAISANPGVLGTSERYHFSGGFGYAKRGLHWNFGAVDGVTAPVVFGLVYSGDRYNPPLTVRDLPGWQVPGQDIENKKRNHDLATALAIPMAKRRFSVGLGGSIAFYNHDRQGKGTTGNMTGGLGFRPIPELVLGLSARNFLPIVDDTADRPLEFLGGLWFGRPDIGSITAEGGWRPDGIGEIVMGAGAEVVPAKGSFIRAGWRLEDKVNDVRAGFGLGSEQAAVDIGMAVPTNRFTKPADWSVQLSIRFMGSDPDKDPSPDRPLEFPRD